MNFMFPIFGFPIRNENQIEDVDYEDISDEIGIDNSEEENENVIEK